MASKHVEGRVAHGRSVRTQDRTHGPGEIVALPAAEHARLSELGFLVDPDAGTAPTAPDSATIAVADGTSIAPG